MGAFVQPPGLTCCSSSCCKLRTAWRAIDVEQHHRPLRGQAVLVGRVDGDVAATGLAQRGAGQLHDRAARVAPQPAFARAPALFGKAHADRAALQLVGAERAERANRADTVLRARSGASISHSDRRADVGVAPHQLGLLLRQRHAHRERRIGEQVTEQFALLAVAAELVGLARQNEHTIGLGAHLQPGTLVLVAGHFGMAESELLAQRRHSLGVRGDGLEHRHFQVGRVGHQARAFGLEPLVAQGGDQVARLHPLAVDGREGIDETVHPRAQLRLLGRPHHPLGLGAERRRHQRDQRDHTSGQRAAAPQQARAAGPCQRAQPAGHRAQHAVVQHESAQRSAGQRRMAADPQADGQRQGQPVGGGQRRINDQPLALTRQRLQRGRHRRAKQVAQALGPPAPAAHAQVAQVEHVAQEKVAVETHQRVAVDEQRGGCADQHRQQGQVAQQAGLHQQPHGQRHGRHRQLGHDAGRADDGTLVAVPKAVGPRRVDERHWREQHQADAGLVHAGAPAPHRQRMRQLVQQFDEREQQPAQEQVAR